MTAVPRCVEALTAAMPAVRPRLFAAVTLNDTAAAAAAAAVAEGRFMGTAGFAPSIARAAAFRAPRAQVSQVWRSQTEQARKRAPRDTSAERKRTNRALYARRRT